mmetsp:Transcript_12258/g.29967  ORF Transcript_12258/g.29967 Transcript_12258/m.29967 type:complete len:236 (-) Transcript_12258:294-1001(-)
MPATGAGVAGGVSRSEKKPLGGNSSRSGSISTDASLGGIPRAASADNDLLSCDGDEGKDDNDATVPTSDDTLGITPGQSKRLLFRKIKKFTGRMKTTLGELGDTMISAWSHRLLLLINSVVPGPGSGLLHPGTNNQESSPQAVSSLSPRDNDDDDESHLSFSSLDQNIERPSSPGRFSSASTSATRKSDGDGSRPCGHGPYQRHDGAGGGSCAQRNVSRWNCSDGRQSPSSGVEV